MEYRDVILFDLTGTVASGGGIRDALDGLSPAGTGGKVAVGGGCGAGTGAVSFTGVMPRAYSNEEKRWEYGRSISKDGLS